MDASRALVMAPPTVFGGDIAERVTNGDMETSFTGSGTAIVASAWILNSSTTGHIEISDPYAGVSAQALSFAAPVDGSQAFAQQIKGLDTNNDYGASAYIKESSGSVSAFQLYDVVLRVGPNSGGSDFQGSASATAAVTSDYELMEATWTNTAANLWIWISVVKKDYDIVLSGGFEGGYTNGLADGWYADSTIATEANDTDPYIGLSAQQLYYPPAADGSQVFGQLLTGLVENQDYTLSSVIKHVSATSLSDNDVVVMIGPDTGDPTNIQASVSARNAAYAPAELTWQNTADSVWVMVKVSSTADTTDKVTNGDMEGNYSSGVAPNWIISDNLDGNGLTATVDETNVRVGTSAQKLSWSSTADGTEAFAQQLTGLSTGHDYVASAFIKVLSPTAADSHDVWFRIGPNSGGADYQASVSATNDSTADFVSVEVTWPNTATEVWAWVAATSGSEIAVVDGISANLSAVNAMVLVDTTSGSLTASLTLVGVTADDVSVRSASSNEMDSITATNAVGIQTPFWTLTCPNGITTPASGQPYIVQVNNANSLDEAKRSHYVNPINQALKSSASFYNQDEAIDAAFEGNWVNWGDLSSSAFVGSGNYRWMRIVNTGSFTGAASAFKAHLWTMHMSEMI